MYKFYDKRNTYLFMKEASKRKRQSVTIEVVDLTKDNRKTFPSGTGFSPVRKKLFGDEKTERVDDDCFFIDDSTISKNLSGDVKTERVDDDCLRTDDDHIQYYRNNRNLPKFR